ncbi:secondary thiamine-phosphate synthase enzyme YjbQ [Neptunicella marina]|uniref:YjbQ family protein n=1 Tax=Neptunicella marina TaxID=2125989 RepID=A0A8J6IWZ4_9ALTE|nr:secondary thiamine-phosphate synthase enzyme YjbQ [Neptunicella marina]MBC3767569.1 YjbQ family protein [Neptunicella marina]
MWYQKHIIISAKPRGFHLITEQIISALPQIRSLDVGLLNLFITHTSASLAINENADPTVRSDMEAHFNVLAPENAPYYRHTYEGPDDMPAHIKSVLLGASQTIPISKGKLALGTWQGIYLCEHRDHASERTLIATLQGE